MRLASANDWSGSNTTTDEVAFRFRAVQQGRSSALPARRSREQFEKYFLPGFTLALMLGEMAGVFFLWRWLNQPIVPITQPIFALVIFGLVTLVFFVLGRFSVSLARMEKQRLLEPVAVSVLAARIRLHLRGRCRFAYSMCRAWTSTSHARS